MEKLKIGDIAPAINGKDELGNDFNLSDLKGKRVIIFFYPKDDTPTCTKEACNLRDNYSELKLKGYEVIGVSADKEAKHQKFISKYDLPYKLLADVDKIIIKNYGVWGPKKFMGREFLGINRKTFVIDENGIIENIIEKVKAKEHTAQILND